MPVVLTKEYLERTFFIPLKADKSEGVWLRPLTETARNRIQRQALQEAGQDAVIAREYEFREVLKACITDWKGFYDCAHKEIPYSVEVLQELLKIDPAFFMELYVRVLAVARFGVLEDIKN